MRVGVALVGLLLLVSGCLSDAPADPEPEPPVELPPLDGLLPVVSGNWTVPPEHQSLADLIAATPPTYITPEDNLRFVSPGHALFRFQAFEPFTITNYTGGGEFGKLGIVLYAEGTTVPAATCGGLEPSTFRAWYKAAGYETTLVSNESLPAGVYRAVVAATGPAEIGVKLGQGTGNATEVPPIDLGGPVAHIQPEAWVDHMPPGRGSGFSVQLPIDRPSFVLTAVLGSPFVAGGQAAVHSSLMDVAGTTCAEYGTSSDLSGWAPYNQYGPRVAASWLTTYAFEPGAYTWTGSYTWTAATPIGTKNAQALVIPMPAA